MTNEGSGATLRASDGVSIAYHARMAPAGRPVLALVHSLGMDHSFWNAVDARVGDRASLVAIDARGHGRSGASETPATAARMAQDLREVIEHLGLERVVVGGASMGGCIALQFAIDHPECTTGLALIDTTAWYGPAALSEWEARAQKAMSQGLASLTDFQVTRWFSDGFREREPAAVQHWVNVFLRNDLQGYVAACRLLGAFDARAQLAAIRVPTLVQVGEEDYAAPVAMSRDLHAAIAGSRLDVIAGARHLTPLEVPDRVSDALLDLCAQVRP
ncbi:MAG: alpha/beta fold hydrolase [Hydrogenophaga sp.]|nr:alpha/beta fold hydrolase [Hydrogenophaga sp.]